MLNSYPVTKSLLNYKPFSVEKNIKGFLYAKKHQKVFGVLFEGEFDNQIQTIVDKKISLNLLVYFLELKILKLQFCKISI